VALSSSIARRMLGRNRENAGRAPTSRCRRRNIRARAVNTIAASDIPSTSAAGTSAIVRSRPFCIGRCS